MAAGPTVFRARRLVRVLVGGLDVLFVVLTALIAVWAWDKDDGMVLAVTGPGMAAVAAALAVITNTSFATLALDDRGVELRRWIGSRRVLWMAMDRVHFWEECHAAPHGGSAREWFAAAYPRGGGRSLRLKSTFAREAFHALAGRAAAAGVRVVHGPP